MRVLNMLIEVDELLDSSKLLYNLGAMIQTFNKCIIHS